MPYELTIIVPVYNEAENVIPLAEETVAAVAPVNPDYELVFVDDCSSDETWQRIQEAHAKNPRVRGLRMKQRGGQSAAVWSGIQATTRPVLATMDGDRQNDPADYPRMLEELSHVDFVCGWRKNRKDSFVRRVSSKVARRARRAVLKADFADTGCAMRVFRRESLRGVFGFNGLHRFLPVIVANGGFTCKEIEVNHRARVAGISKYGIGNRLWRGILDLFAMWWYQKRRFQKLDFEEIAAQGK